MSNQHAGLSQVLAEQRMTQLQEQAAHARLWHGARRPRRWQRAWTVRGWLGLPRFPGGSVTWRR
jgi:hypothetical protein